MDDAKDYQLTSVFPQIEVYGEHQWLSASSFSPNI